MNIGSPFSGICDSILTVIEQLENVVQFIPCTSSFKKDKIPIYLYGRNWFTTQSEMTFILEHTLMPIKVETKMKEKTEDYARHS